MTRSLLIALAALPSQRSDAPSAARAPRRALPGQTAVMHVGDVMEVGGAPIGCEVMRTSTEAQR